MKIRYLLALLAVVTAPIGFTRPVAAADGSDDLVVIVNPASGVAVLSATDAINIFMGRYRKLPSGLIAFPIDLGERSQQRRMFYAVLVRKDLSEIDAYWARLVFSGETSPPLQVPDSSTAVQLVAGNRSAIAYVERKAVDERVRIVMKLDATETAGEAR